MLVLKGFSPNTIRTYSIEFAQLLYIIKDFPIQNLSADKLQSYFLYCHKNLQLSENAIHSRMNAVSYTHLDVYKRQIIVGLNSANSFASFLISS